ncbi:cyclase-like protein 3 [Quercus robur]|uniref:cyclase-like protein 3 n=1 Tax=Quercus robur TaxID=38942 RepID=UPI002161A0D3|nr:cyclase-like protein 3 [Quercus robur]
MYSHQMIFYIGQWGGLVVFQLQICHVQQMISLMLHYRLNPPFSYSLVPTEHFRKTMMMIKIKPLVLLLVLSCTWVLTVATSDSAYPTISDCGMEELVPVRREVYGNGRIFDISHSFREDMPSWDSVDGLGQFLRLRHSIKNGSLANVSELKYFSVHSGTHVDAPGHVFDHYFDAGFDVDTLDLELLNGPALLVDVPRDKNITAEVMKSLNIPKGIRRVIFRTLNTDRRLMWKKEFDTSFAGLMKDGAEWLVENTDIKLIGIDYLSVAAYVEAIPSHLVLLEARDIILVESLKLDHIQPGIYSLHCLPLRLPGAEGSPARCILIK